MDLYASKGRITAMLEPLVLRLAAAGVAPDAVTLAAVPVALVAGACLLSSTAVPSVLLLVPILATLRLVLNLLDGALARRTGRTHARGEVLNELGDRACDIAFLAPIAWLPGASAHFVLVGVLGAVLASHVGVASKAAGGRRLYRGVLSKPGRMALVSIASVAAFAYGGVAWAVFGPLLCLGVALTLLERLVIAFRELA